VGLLVRPPRIRGASAIVASHGAWRSLVSALVWGTRGPEFKSRRPDEKASFSGAFLLGSVAVRPPARTVVVRIVEEVKQTWMSAPGHPQNVPMLEQRALSGHSAACDGTCAKPATLPNGLGSATGTRPRARQGAGQYLR
jgi:hypothetical protein